jgi:hypothetical protein
VKYFASQNVKEKAEETQFLPLLLCFLRKQKATLIFARRANTSFIIREAYIIFGVSQIYHC